jgi:hypothetical protein
MKDKLNTLVPKLRFPQFHGAPGWEATPLRSLATPVTERPNEKDVCHVLTLSAEQGVVLQSEYFGKRVAGTRPTSPSLLHGFHYLKDEGVMAILLPHGVLFRGGAEERIHVRVGACTGH